MCDGLRRIPLLAVLPMLAALAGCGTTVSSPTATHQSSSAGKAATRIQPGSSFRTRAGQACGQFDARLVALPKDTTTAAYAYDTPIIIRDDIALLDTFQTLNPPRHDARNFSQLQAVKRRLIMLLTRQFTLGSDGQTSAVARAGRDYRTTAIRYNHVASALRLNACAAAATPSSSRNPPPLP